MVLNDIKSGKYVFIISESTHTLISAVVDSIERRCEDLYVSVNNTMFTVTKEMKGKRWGIIRTANNDTYYVFPSKKNLKDYFSDAKDFMKQKIDNAGMSNRKYTSIIKILDTLSKKVDKI